MGRLLDALRAKKYGAGDNQKNLINPPEDSSLGLFGMPTTTIQENSPDLDDTEPDCDPAIVEINPPADLPDLPPDDLPDQYGHWTESETVLCIKRIRQFVLRGVPEQIADELACRLVDRDRQQDDRRCCAECTWMVHGCCLCGVQVICGGGTETLHRCKQFAEPKSADIPDRRLEVWTRPDRDYPKAAS